MYRRWGLTPNGATAGGIGLTSLGLWRLAGWTEFGVIGALLILPILIGVGFVLGRPSLHIERRVPQHRVSVGDVLQAELRVTNVGRSPIVTGRLIERTDAPAAADVTVDLAGLLRDVRRTRQYDLPTRHRGRWRIGPSVAVKSDPFGFWQRERVGATADTLWVQPQTVAVPALPPGLARDLDAAQRDAAAQGDGSFHSLRPYVIGDDYRHIHWLSSARSSDLLVRQHIDTQRPTIGVLLDDANTSSYELAISVAASLVQAAARDDVPLTLSHGGELHTARLMECLTLAQPDPSSEPREQAQAMLHEIRDLSVVVIITDPSRARVASATAQAVSSSAIVVVVWCGPDTPPPLDAVTSVHVNALDAFPAAWVSGFA